MKEHDCKHGMTMRYPATRWQDALPTGSGILGAISERRIYVNGDGRPVSAVLLCISRITNRRSIPQLPPRNRFHHRTRLG